MCIGKPCYWNKVIKTKVTLHLPLSYFHGFQLWFSASHSIFSLLDIPYTNNKLKCLNLNNFKKSIKRIVLTKYKEFGAQFRLNNIDGKLRTYFSIKDHLETEQYLSVIKDFDKRRRLTKFRISSNKLKIETGIFTRPLTALEQRVCGHCLMTIEDEYHFLM